MENHFGRSKGSGSLGGKMEGAWGFSSFFFGFPLVFHVVLVLEGDCLLFSTRVLLPPKLGRSDQVL